MRGGAVFNGDIRAYATFSKVGYDYLDQITLSASADKLFPVYNKMSFYAGGTLGYTSFDFDDAGKESGLLAGVQGGIFYQATPAIGVDIGVSYSITTAEFEYKEPYTESYTVGRTTYTYEENYEEKEEFESVLAFKVGVDYKF